MLHSFSSLPEKKASAFLQAAPFWPVDGGKDNVALERALNKQANWYLRAGGEQWQWLAALEPLEFDSRLFGFAMARLEPLAHLPVWPDEDSLASGREFFQDLQLQAMQQGLRFLMARVNSRDMLAAQCLEKAGFSLMDVSVEWGLDLANLPRFPANGLAVRPWQDADKAALLGLAGRAFSDLNAYADRFTLDARLRPHSARLYEAWLDNCFKGLQASQVLVLDGGQGFIALRLPENAGAAGWVVLNAIEPGQRGRGLYNYLLLAGLHWLKENGAARVRIRTKLSQQAVIRAWSRLGGIQLSSDMTFHWWSEKPQHP